MIGGETALADLVDVIRGISFPTSAKRTQPRPGLVACLRTSNVQSTVEWDDLLYVDAEHVKSDEQLVRPGDILVSMSNSLDLVGKCAIVTSVPTRAAFGAFIAAVRVRKGVDPRYVFHAMRSPSFKAYLRRAASTTTNISNINSSKLLAGRVPFFGEGTSQRIVSKIDELFSRIDEGERALQRVHKLVGNYRQSVLKAAVSGELTREWREKNKDNLESGEVLLARILKVRREAWEMAELEKMKIKGMAPANDNWKQRYQEPALPDISDLPSLPSGWVWASLDQLCIEFGNGLSRKPANEPPGEPILRISAVRPLAVDTSDIRYYVVQDGESLDGLFAKRGDLLFTRYNGSRELVGVSGVVKTLERVLHPDKLIKARPAASELVAPDYIAIAMNCGASWRHITSCVKTSAGQHGIAGSDIRRAPVPVPSTEEQRHIVDAFALADGKCSEARASCAREVRRSTAARQAVLKAAFGGQLVAQDSADYPASRP